MATLDYNQMLKAGGTQSGLSFQQPQTNSYTFPQTPQYNINLNNQGLQVQKPIGPGFGNYGPKDVYKRGGVLGASIDTTQRPQQIAPQQTPPQQFDIKQEINDWYSGIASMLDNRIGGLPTQQTELQGNINQIAQSQQQGLEAERDAQLDKFSGYRQEVAQNQGNALTNLAGDIRNLMQAGNNYLGNRNAGDSSASKMYSYALTKEGNKNRASILNQANKSYNDLNMKETEIKSAASQAINEIQTWKATRMAEIAQYIQSQKSALEQGKIDARQVGYDRALQYLQQLDQQSRSWQQAVQQWGMERMSQLNNIKLQMGQTAQFNAPQLVAGEIQGAQGVANNAQEFMYNPYALQRKDKQQGQL